MSLDNVVLENIKPIKTMKAPIALVENESSFTTFHFYSNFLVKVAEFYTSNDQKKPIEFSMVIETDVVDLITKKHFIDPIALPLLLSLGEQLKRYHNNTPLILHLSNNPGTIKLLEFLYRADFFYLVGKNMNPYFPIGKDIFEFNEAYIGGFGKNGQRPEHKIRCYSLSDNNLLSTISSIENEELQRDYLVEYYTFKVQEHFSELLYENESTIEFTNDFIEILAELITNGVLHSQSNAFVLMFSDRYKTKFSISDNGIGLFNSLSKKTDSNFYRKFEIFNLLSKSFELHVSEQLKNSILAIFETLYYSMLKDRQGLFDLMCNVVINCNGYFRLHNDNAQIIISHRMVNELHPLYVIRQEIVETHNSKLFGKIDNESFESKIQSLSQRCLNSFLGLANSIFKKYSQDIRFSSIRLYQIRFRGVHIEVEIPYSN